MDITHMAITIRTATTGPIRTIATTGLTIGTAGTGIITATIVTITITGTKVTGDVGSKIRIQTELARKQFRASNISLGAKSLSRQAMRKRRSTFLN